MVPACMYVELSGLLNVIQCLLCVVSYRLLLLLLLVLLLPGLVMLRRRPWATPLWNSGQEVISDAAPSPARNKPKCQLLQPYCSHVLGGSIVQFGLVQATNFPPVSKQKQQLAITAS